MNKNLTWIATCITLQKKPLKKHVLFIMLIVTFNVLSSRFININKNDSNRANGIA